MALSSCDLFNTRDPENPDKPGETFPQASDEEVLMNNFQQAIQLQNVQEYEKLFADTIVHTQAFIFIPNQSANARYLSFFSSWNKQSERNYFQNALNALNSDSPPQVTFSNITKVKYQSDSAVWSLDYTIFLPHKLTGIPKQYAGKSDFYLSPSKNIWMIYRWVDFETKKDSSWSELKGQFTK